MSLVSEALRKARQEAAEKGARQRGMVFRTTLVLGADRERSGLGWIVGGIVVASALAGAGIAWWLIAGRPGTPAPAGPTSHAPAAASLPAPASATVAPVTPTPAEVPVEPTPPAALTPGSGLAVAAVAARGRTLPAGVTQTPAGGAAPGERATAVPPQAPETAREPAASPATPAAARSEVETRRAPRPPAEAAEGQERTFVVDADLGKVKLHLDYIVYRPRDPFAAINGQEVMVGSLIEGFTVEEISPEMVRLRDARGVVVLRTH